MKKILLTLLLCLVCSSAFADVGPLTAQYQQRIKETGSIFIKFNDYSYSDAENALMLMQNKKTSNKRVPSSINWYATNGDCLYIRTQHLGKYSGLGDFATLIQKEKQYELNFGKNEGEIVEENNRNSVAVKRNDYFPIVLGLLLPEELKSEIMKARTASLTFKESTTENIDGIIYQCEVYSGLFPYSKEVIYDYKLFFINNEPVMFTNNFQHYDEILEITNVVNNNWFKVPRGFSIYSSEKGGMADLLQQKVVVEQY